jgi:hypothetical protein
MKLAVGNRVLVNDTQFTERGLGVITKIITVREQEAANRGSEFYYDRIIVLMDTGSELTVSQNRILEVLPSLESVLQELRTAQACSSQSNIMSAWLKLQGMVHTEGQNLGFIKK